MAIPPSAVRFAAEMDPGDQVDFVMDFAPLLDTAGGEQIASGDWQISMSAEGAALGLTIGASGGYQPALQVNNTRILSWLSVDPASQDDADFNSGADVAMTARFSTTNVPPRRFERTFVVRVINK